jgi:hypothetical protein
MVLGLEAPALHNGRKPSILTALAAYQSLVYAHMDLLLRLIAYTS